MKYAVDAESDTEVLLSGFEMDVRGPLVDGAGDDRVHQLDHGGVFSADGETVEILRLSLFGGQLGQIADRLVKVSLAPNRVLEIGSGRNLRENVVPRHRTQVIHREHIRRIGHRHHETAVFESDRQQRVPADQIFGHDGDCRRINPHFGEIDVGHADLLPEGFDQLRFGDHTALDQNLAEGQARLMLTSNRCLEFFRGEQAFFEQQCPEMATISTQRRVLLFAAWGQPL